MSSSRVRSGVGALRHGQRRGATRAVALLAGLLVAGVLVAPIAAGATSSAGWRVGATYAPGISPITGISCVTKTTCEAVSTNSAFAFRTTDGGAAWSTQALAFSYGYGPTVRISCASADVCVVVSDGDPQGTNDAGAVWTTQSVPSASNTDFMSVSCAAGSQVCVAATANGLDYTTHAAASSVSWKAGTLPAGSFGFGAVTCVTSTKCIAVGGTSSGCPCNAVVLQTVNSGATWTVQANVTASTEGLSVVTCPSSSECLAEGPNGWFETTNESAGTPTWSNENGPGVSDVFQISCPSVSECYVGSGNDAFSTSNANSLSATWNGETLPASVNIIYGIDCPSTAECLAVGSSTSSPSVGLIVSTANASSGTRASWRDESLPTTVGEVAGIACSSPAECVAVGFGTLTGPIKILRTTNGGTTWSEETNHPTPAGEQSLNAVACPSAKVCYAVGRAAAPAVILVTSNGGSTWTSEVVPSAITEGDLLSISCVSVSTCEVVGDTSTNFENGSGVILTTTNGGAGSAGWKLRTLPENTGPLESVSCKSVSDCVAVGQQTFQAGGEVFYTTDGGSSWNAGTLPTTTPTPIGGLLGIACTSTADCEAVGYIGAQAFEGTAVALRSSDGGKVWSKPQSVPSGITGLNAVSCPSSTVCDAVGDIGVSGAAAIVTTDSGSKWVKQNLPAQLNYLVAITCPLVNYCQAGGTSLAGGGVLATYVPPPLVLTTSKLPTAKIDKVFSARLAATGGAGSYTWLRSAGALPKGLVLSSAGVISGKPTKKGIGSFSVEVRDGLGHSATKKFKLTVT